MAGLAFQIPGGRYRRAEFFVCIPPGMNRQFLLDGVRAFKQEVREFFEIVETFVLLFRNRNQKSIFGCEMKVCSKINFY